MNVDTQISMCVSIVVHSPSLHTQRLSSWLSVSDMDVWLDNLRRKVCPGHVHDYSPCQMVSSLGKFIAEASLSFLSAASHSSSRCQQERPSACSLRPRPPAASSYQILGVLASVQIGCSVA